jgi:hypothetical protein
MKGQTVTTEETVLLTIFLKHDQTKNLESIQGHLGKHEWWERFPPAGAEIVSWNVVMGIGQIVTLRLPPRLIPIVNVEIERSAWGVFQTEFFPTYDFVPVRERITRQWRESRQSEAPDPAIPAKAAKAATKTKSTKRRSEAAPAASRRKGKSQKP